MVSWFSRVKSTTVVCDISRSSVKILAYHFDKSARTISFITKKKLSLPANATKLDSFVKAIASLKVFIDEFTRHQQVAIDEVLISIPSAVVLSEIHEFRFERPRPNSQILPAELAELWKRLRAEAVAVLLPQGLPENSYRIFPPEAERVTIDGYELPRDLALTGKEIAIQALISVWPVDFAEVADGLLALFPKVRFSFIPEAIAIRDFVRIRKGPTVSGVVLDIGACDSTMLLFDHGVLQDVWSFPFGGEDITKAAAKELSISLLDAEAMKRQWISGVLDIEVSERFGAISTRIIDFWKREWGSLLQSRAATAVIVPHVHLLGRGAIAPHLIEALSDPEWLESFSAGVSGEVALILPSKDEKGYFPGWPFDDSGDAVIFSHISRMIQSEYHA